MPRPSVYLQGSPLGNPIVSRPAPFPASAGPLGRRRAFRAYAFSHRAFPQASDRNSRRFTVIRMRGSLLIAP